MASIIETAVNSGNFTTLVAAIKKADLVDDLSGAGPFTVFAPNDMAFEQLPPGALDRLLENTDNLRKVLLYHVISGKVTSVDIEDEEIEWAPTLEGENLNIDASIPGSIMVDDATIISADIMCDNGIIHVIDEVLLPSIVEQALAA